MDRRADALRDAILALEDSEDGSECIGGAGGVGDEVVCVRVV